MVSQCKYEELKLTFESAAQIKLVDLVDHRDLRSLVTRCMIRSACL